MAPSISKASQWLGPDGRDAGQEARLHLSLPGRGIKPLEREATLRADGYWHVPDVPIPYPGHWHMRIDAVTDFQKVTLEDDFDVPARPPGP
jgi:copper transport protein